MIKQVYNPRSKKWVKIDCSCKGGIIDMQAEKFEGIPVKGEKNNEHQNTKEKGVYEQETQESGVPGTPGATEETEESYPVSEMEKQSNSSDSDWFW